MLFQKTALIYHILEIASIVNSEFGMSAIKRACGIRSSFPGCMGVVALVVFISVAITVLILFWTGIA
jgi:hypothetical protein